MEAEQTALRRLAWAVAGFLMVGLPGISVGATDGYLEALKAEAQSLDSGKTAVPAPTTQEMEGWSQQSQGLKEELEPDLSRSQFESELQKNFFGSFMFYSKLNNVQREAVYSQYRQSGKLADVRNKITELLKQ